MSFSAECTMLMVLQRCHRVNALEADTEVEFGGKIFIGMGTLQKEKRVRQRGKR